MRWKLSTLGRKLEQLSLERASGALHRSINRRLQALDDTEYRMREVLRRKTEADRRRLAALETCLQNLDVRVRFGQAHRRLDAAESALQRIAPARITASAARLEPLRAHLTQLSPLKILDRGYAIVTNESGRIVKSADDAPAGTTIQARLAAGQIIGVVAETKPQ
jgi:exodeoxyribonuclease VII large subunit